MHAASADGGVNEDKLYEFVLACQRNDLCMVQTMLQDKAILDNVNQVCNKARFGLHDVTPLIAACLKGSLDVVQELLHIESVRNNAHQGNAKKTTPLHFASDHGHEYVVQELLKIEAVAQNAHVVDMFGNTPLLCACQGDYRSVVKILLMIEGIRNCAHRANVAGKTALLMASGLGSLFVVQELLNIESVRNSAHRVSTYKFVNWTPLSRASYYGHFSVVKELLKIKKVQESINPSAIAMSPLALACLQYRYKTAKLLLQHNANMYVEIESGQTLFDVLQDRAESGNDQPLTDALDREKIISLRDIVDLYHAVKPNVGSTSSLSWVILDAYEQLQHGNRDLMHYILFKFPKEMSKKTNNTMWQNEMVAGFVDVVNSRSAANLMKFLVKTRADLRQADRYIAVCNYQEIPLPVSTKQNHPISIGIFGHDTRKLSERFESKVDEID